jgi:SET domain-containing protein
MTQSAGGLPPVVDETDDRFYLAESTIPGAGRGVFARVPLQAGDCLEVIGVLVAPGSEADRSTTYGDAYKYQVDGLLLLPVGYGGMVNHSNRPNMEKLIQGRRLWFRATREIAAGEELFLQYSDYARTRFGLD